MTGRSHPLSDLDIGETCDFTSNFKANLQAEAHRDEFKVNLGDFVQEVPTASDPDSLKPLWHLILTFLWHYLTLWDF